MEEQIIGFGAGLTNDMEYRSWDETFHPDGRPEKTEPSNPRKGKSGKHQIPPQERQDGVGFYAIYES